MGSKLVIPARKDSNFGGKSMNLKLSWVLLALTLIPGYLFGQSPAKKGIVGLSGWVVFNDAGNLSLRDFAAHAAVVDRVYLEAYHCGEDGMPALNAEATDALRKYAVAAA